MLGLTVVVGTVVVSAAFVYHVIVPLAQVAIKDVLCPAQIVAGLAETLVGAKGVGFTVTVLFTETLLQPAVLTQAT